MADSSAPPGWAYNLSIWSQLLPIVALAFVGFGIAMYLALYQWGVLASVWEPFFGEGSRMILTSSVSHLLPIPDAALGAFGYLLDAVAGLIGGRPARRREPCAGDLATGALQCLVYAVPGLSGHLSRHDRAGDG